MKKAFQFYGAGLANGKAEPDPLVLGGKGARLVTDTRHGFPVPPGFTIPTYWCKKFDKLTVDGVSVSPQEFLEKFVDVEVMPALEVLQEAEGDRPFMVSVRSGAPVSMPGMMDTVLNVGLGTDFTKLQDVRKAFGDVPALDCFRRLVKYIASTCYGMDSTIFEDLREVTIVKNTVEEWEYLAKASVQMFETNTGEKWPKTMREQMILCVRAVWASWNSERAVAYRKHHEIRDDLYTAVNIQVMRFGNLDEKSCTGVVFTRDPKTGADLLWGEFLTGAQGEDVVAGTHDAVDIKGLKGWDPEVYEYLIQIATESEKHYGDMQDLEFTVESGVLWLLQSRRGKREAGAAFHIARAMFENGDVQLHEALQMVTAEQWHALRAPRIDEDNVDVTIATGIGASSGVVSGTAAMSNTAAAKLKEQGIDVVLVRPMTEPEDLPGMIDSVGILTAQGGMTSHAAVVARDMNKPAVVGAGSDLFKTIAEGDVITIDGSTGRVWVGQQPILPPEENEDAAYLLSLAYGFADAHWTIEAGDPLPDADKIYVDTKRADHNAMCTMVAQLLDNQHVTGVIDLYGIDELIQPEDDLLWGLCGEVDATGGFTHPTDKGAWLADLIQKVSADKAQSIRDRFVLRAPPGTLVPEGMQCLHVVNDLNELLEADGPIILSDVFKASLGDNVSKLKEKFQLAEVLDPEGKLPEYAVWGMLG